MPRKKYKITIVHPHDDLAKALRDRLELDGFDVLTFASQPTALSYISAYPSDLVITADYPEGMGVIDFIDVVRSINVLGNTSVLAITDESSSVLDEYSKVSYIPKTATNSVTVISGVYDLLGLSTTRH